MIEQDLKHLITSKYKSVKEFASITGIPYTTLDSILKRGVDKANVLNIIKLCKELNLDVDALSDGQIRAKVNNPVISILTPLQQELMEAIKHMDPSQLAATKAFIGYLGASTEADVIPIAAFGGGIKYISKEQAMRDLYMGPCETVEEEEARVVREYQEKLKQEQLEKEKE